MPGSCWSHSRSASLGPSQRYGKKRSFGVRRQSAGMCQGAHLIRAAGHGTPRFFGHCTFRGVLERAVVDCAQNLGLEQEITEARRAGGDVARSRLSWLAGSALLLLLVPSAPRTRQSNVFPAHTRCRVRRGCAPERWRARQRPKALAEPLQTVAQILGVAGAPHLVGVGVILGKILVSHCARLCCVAEALRYLKALWRTNLNTISRKSRIWDSVASLPPTHSAPSAMLTKLAVWQGGLQICPGFDGCPISWCVRYAACTCCARTLRPAPIRGSPRQTVAGRTIAAGALPHARTGQRGRG